MFTFAEKLKQMSNIEHKDVGVSSLKGTPSRKIYIKTSTEAVYNPEGVTQEYINNHVDGSKIVNGTVTNNKIADMSVTMPKLSNDVQTLIHQGADSSWTPMGDYDVDALYYANDLVFDHETNSSYLSLRADNMGHAVTDETWWMKVVDGSVAEEAAEVANEAAQAANAAANELLNDFQGKGTWVWGYPVYAKPEDIGKGYDRGNIVYHEPTNSSYISRIDGNKTEPTGATNTSWQLLISGSDIGKKDIKKYPTPDPDTVYTLSPNIMYEFGEATVLSIRFNNLEIRAGKLNEFQFSFISGDLATTLTVPESVVWTSTVSIEANMQYGTNIIYNETSDKYFGIIVGWPLDTENVPTNEITEEGE